VAGIIVTYVSYPIYLHFLGYRELGLWLILSTILTAIQVANLGLDGAVLSCVARELGVGAVDRAGRMVSTAALLVVAVGVGGTVVVSLCANEIVRLFGLSGEEASLAAALVPYVAGLSVLAMASRVVDAAVGGLGRMDLANIGRIGGRLVGLALAAVLLVSGTGVVSMAIANGAMFVFQLSVGLLIVRRGWPLRVFYLPRFDRGCARELLALGGGLTGAAAAGMLITPLNRFVLARFAGVEEIPLYDMAYSASMYLRSVFEAGLRALIPEVGVLGYGGTARSRQTRELVGYAEGAVICVALPVWLAVFLLAPVGLQVWLGAQFVPEAVSAFRVMLAASWFSLVGVPGYYCLLGLGKTRPLMTAQTVNAVISASVVLGLAVVVGTATATSAAWGVAAGCAVSSALLLYCWRTCGTNDVIRNGRGGDA
jgi:O-antigen/teichoic acid export membrane protein